MDEFGLSLPERTFKHLPSTLRTYASGKYIYEKKQIRLKTMSENLDEEIIRRTLDPERENPAPQIAEIIADIEDIDITKLPTMYHCVDWMLDNLFSQPPDPEAQMKIEFSYETYRITIDQDGTAEFVKTE
jgi:hypothetical protein